MQTLAKRLPRSYHIGEFPPPGHAAAGLTCRSIPQPNKTGMTPKHKPLITNNLCNVLYCSHATAQMNQGELPRILETAQRNNARHSITGLLVYGGGMFLQWLEGPRDKVEALMAKLGDDPRHETIVRLQVLDGLKERLYPTWAMRSVAPSEIHEILIDCLSRARSDSHAHMISLMVELLHTDQLAPIHR